ncbi:MAG TPA: HAD-IA family hydrolase [Thermoleophilaceae bacterium]|nr:HAD-IA family hydrolase [Thermoleophilaceae bacterium]
MTHAVLLDALGTLVELQPPAPRLQRLLQDDGFEVSEEQAAAGFMAEIAYYLDHHLDGSDPERLERLRDRCADEMRRALGIEELDHARARRAMLGALEFTPYPDVEPALRELRDRGVKRVIASNWDCSLPEWLRPTGILDLVDGVVTSAEVGAAKPSPRVFQRALGVAGVEPGDALHVGDKVDNDIEGAAAAGIRGVLLQREGDPPPGVESIRSLAELPALL